MNRSEARVGFTAEEIAAERITARIAIRGGPHLEHAKPSQSSCFDPVEGGYIGPPDRGPMVAGWAAEAAGQGVEHEIIKSPAVAKEANAIVALALKRLILRFDGAPLHVLITACGFLTRLVEAERLDEQNWRRNSSNAADARGVWSVVLEQYRAGALEIEELGAKHPRMRWHTALRLCAENERDAARKGWKFPALIARFGTTFDRFDIE
jgi:hypothetical protein